MRAVSDPRGPESRPAVSMIVNSRSPRRPSPSRRSRVTPGWSSTSASFCPTSRLNSVDLPTLGRLMIAMVKDMIDPVRFYAVICRRPRGADLMREAAARQRRRARRHLLLLRRSCGGVMLLRWAVRTFFLGAAGGGAAAAAAGGGAAAGAVAARSFCCSPLYSSFGTPCSTPGTPSGNTGLRAPGRGFFVSRKLSMSVGSNLFTVLPPQPDRTHATATSMAPVNARDTERVVGNRTGIGFVFCGWWLLRVLGFRVFVFC